MSDYKTESRYMQLPSFKSDNFKLEFQGSLVKVIRQPLLGWVQDKDAHNLKKQVRREIIDAVRSGSISMENVVTDEFGQIQLVKMSDTLRAWLHQKAYDKLVTDDAPKRGKIGQFSSKSRKRLLEWVSRLNRSVKGLFITLTYRENMQDYVAAKKHLDLTLRWIKNNYPGYAIIWRMEEQERGAIHFHLLVLGATFIHAMDLTRHWQKITGDDSYPDVKKIRNRRQALYYASKYMAKAAQAANGFIPVPYSEIENSSSAWRGRFWGIVNRAFLPLAELTTFVWSGQLLPILDFRRSASRKSRFVQRFGRINGFTLFAGAGWWLRLWEYYASISRGGAVVASDGRRRSGLTVQNIGSGYRDMLAFSMNLS
jgi:hypothetical protein